MTMLKFFSVQLNFVYNFGGKLAAAAIVGVLGGLACGAFLAYMCLKYFCKE